MHRFQYRLFMVYLDLAEVESLVGPGKLISNRRFAARSLLRRDHLRFGGLTMLASVRQLLKERTGQVSQGPVRLLAQLRYFGAYFSPLNLYYVFDQSDTRVQSIVAEVSNTPWHQRHYYVLWSENRTQLGNGIGFRHPKQFHVSPFMDMQLDYDWRLNVPGERLSVSLRTLEKSCELFVANMQLKRRQLTSATLRRMSLRYPLMTAQVFAAIYYQALKLWWKQCPFYPHPNQRNQAKAPHVVESPAVLSKT